MRLRPTVMALDMTEVSQMVELVVVSRLHEVSVSCSVAMNGQQHEEVRQGL